MKTKNVIFSLIAAMFIILSGCEEEKVAVTGVSLNDYELSLTEGETAQLTATVDPVDAEEQGVLWSTSDAGVATVANGLVSAVSAGTATITVSTVDGGFTATCTVTVKSDAVELTGISLDVSKVDLSLGETKQLVVSYSPADATNKTVQWSSSNIEVASVSDNGLITATGTGTAIVLAISGDSKYSASCEVTVTSENTGESKGTVTELLSKSFGLRTPNAGSGGGEGVEIAADATGVPYIVFTGYDSELAKDARARVQVWKYNGAGTDWAQFGPDVAITTTSAVSNLQPGMTIAPDGRVYVSYVFYDNIDDELFNSTLVSYSTGGEWTLMGTKMQSGTNVMNEASELALKDDGTLLIALTDNSDGYVYYWTGEAWSSYNGYKTDNAEFSVDAMEIMCHGNTPYVTIAESMGRMGSLKGKDENGLRGDGNQWEWLGNSLVSDDAYYTNANQTSMAIHPDGTVYAAYIKYVPEQIDHFAFVERFNNETEKWEMVGSGTLANNSNPAEVVISGNEVYLLVGVYNGGIQVHKLDENEEWTLQATTPRIEETYTFDCVAGQNGEIFMAYECTSTPGQVGAFKYTPAE